MLKTALVSVNVMGLILCPFLFVDDVSVSHTIPSSIQTGEEKIVEVVLDKGDVTGPARLKLSFENIAGIEIEEVESEGATFSFNNNELLFIWFSIPGKKRINLKYKLKANRPGVLSVNGSFSYVDNAGERQKIPVPANVVEVSGNAVATNKSNTGEEKIDDVVILDTDIRSEPNDNYVDDVVATRTITPEGTDFIVTVKINKKSGKGFARLRETVPADFKITSMENAMGLFTYKEGLVKYLWSAVPKNQENIEIKYRLTPDGALPDTYDIAGEFSAEFLVVDEVSKPIKIPATSFYYPGEDVAVNDPVEDPVTDPIEDPVTDPIEDPVTTPVTDPVEDPVTDPVVDPVVDPVKNTTANIAFRVQIAAGHKNVSRGYFKKMYRLNDRVEVESHQGWIKYTVGNFDRYNGARNKRESLARYDLPGPFVTAYNMGERISVQEALMVTNQNWIK